MFKDKYLESESRKLARLLLEIGAVKLNTEEPFTWASGKKSPIYCDNRLTLSHPSIRDYIKEKLAKLVRQHYPSIGAIAGVATAGIPQGVLLADALELPFLYVRSRPKGHGMENMIEGEVVRDQKVLLVEDLISTGGSVLRAAAALDLVGLQIEGVVAIFTYDFDDTRKRFNDAEIPIRTLTNYNILVEEAMTRKYISAKALSSLQHWRESPDTWITG